jgi:flagellar hook-associated protein 2
VSSLNVSAINLNDYLSQSLAYLRRPITNLEFQISRLEVKKAVFTDLSQKLSALEDALDRVSEDGASSVFRRKAVTSSAESVITAVASGDALAGSHTVFVTQLAKSHTLVSNRYDRSGTALSQAYAGTRTFSITVDGETYDVSVEITGGESDATVLANVATAINETADGAVQGSYVMDTPSTGRLSVRSGSTGTAGSMTFTDTDGLLAGLGLTNGTEATDTTGGYVYADLGGNELDAKLTVDGINVVSSDNVVESVIEGLTLTLLGEQDVGDTPAALTVAVDTETIKAEVQSFLEVYNEAFTYLGAKTKVDGLTYERGVLAGDFPYVSLRINMRGIMATYVGAASSSYNSLSQIGITSDRSGNFSITDAGLLEEAIVSNPNALESLFAGEEGVASLLSDLLSGYTEPGGSIASGDDAVDDRIDMINKSIERQERRLELKEQDLRDQYAALQEALYSLQQTMSMTSMFSNLVGV